MIVVVNLLGLAMFFVAAGVSAAITHALGISNIGLLLIINGPVLAAIDIAYRRIRKASLFRRGGGSFMFLPVWIWGVLFVVSGVLHLVQH